MAQVLTALPPVPAQKRGPGRPPKYASTPNKRLKLSDVNEDNLSGLTSKQDTPLSDRRARGLPTKLNDLSALPTLSQPQSISLPDAEYASIATSGVLAKSLEQSRISWTQNGVFERYWVKPETGKNARPPPPNNPDVKSMKSRGRCRLRIEPHIFEVEVYVVEKPKLPAQSKQYLPPKQQGAYGQVWNQQYQGQSTHASAGAAPQQTIPPNAAGQDKKTMADPVIGLLASRAGSDPELKALMREVAAGHAPPEQLKVFQQHIDELNALLREQRIKEGAQQRAHASQQATYAQPQKYVPPPPAPPSEVVFSFTTQGASSDRFLFPQHCILETLTPQHLLASFVLVKNGSEVANTADIDINKQYWSPITLMVEVAYGRESILEDMKRWVKSADESRAFMAKTIAEVEKVPDTHLALRLPLKGTAAAAESMNTSKTGTPVPQIVDDKRKKEIAGAKKRSSLGTARAVASAVQRGETTASSDTVVKAASHQTASIKTEDEDANVKEGVSASGRPTRATRKSTRLSDVM